MRVFVKILIRTAQGVAIVLTLLVLFLIYGFMHPSKDVAEFCAPGDRIERTRTNKVGVTADLHLCPDPFMGYHYYLTLNLPRQKDEKHPSFGEGEAPELEWEDDTTLKIILSEKTEYVSQVDHYKGINFHYVRQKPPASAPN